MINEYEHRYDDIINLPHHVSKKHTQMSLIDRAAQFSAFAALTGYGDEVEETARLTDVQADLDEEVKAELNRKLRVLAEHSADKPSVTITYFVPDTKKSGGKYVSVKGDMKRLDEYERTLIMTDETIIPIDRITEIDGNIFNNNMESRG